MTVALLAHVITAAPVWPLWVSSAVLFGGLGMVLATRGGGRRVAAASAAFGLAATVALYVLLPGEPAAPPGVALRLAAPVPGSTVTSPVVVSVCPTGAAVPGGGLLAISVDGGVVAEVGVDSAAVAVAPGPHRLSVELVTSTHRRYTPAVSVEAGITVVGHAAPTAPPPCAVPATPRGGG